VQTRIPDHDILDAALHGDPSRMVAGELERREALRFPPIAALAAVSGPVANELIERLGSSVEILGPDDGRWLVRAADAAALADAFAAAGRPPGRLRIEVDPLRI
jgi:primosomal protein N' (replication factor Y)